MAEFPGDREAGGLWCHQVLEHLDAWVDGSLPPEVREMAAAHLAECDNCTRFGGAYAAVVAKLRQGLGVAPKLDDDVAERLDAHLTGAVEEG